MEQTVAESLGKVKATGSRGSRGRRTGNCKLSESGKRMEFLSRNHAVESRAGVPPAARPQGRGDEGVLCVSGH
jgi:hypothetical protein